MKGPQSYVNQLTCASFSSSCSGKGSKLSSSNLYGCANLSSDPAHSLALAMRALRVVGFSRRSYTGQGHGGQRSNRVKQGQIVTIRQRHTCVGLLLEPRDERVVAVVNLVLEPNLWAWHVPGMDELEFSHLPPNSILCIAKNL